MRSLFVVLTLAACACSSSNTSAPVDGGDDAAMMDAGSDARWSCPGSAVGPMPVDARDVQYTYSSGSADACFTHSFCDDGCAGPAVAKLLACEPEETGYSWEQGSSMIRVVGIQAGACVYDILTEAEAAFDRFTCRAPLPVHAWSGLFAVDRSGLLAPSLTNGLDCTRILSCGRGGCTDGDGGVLDGGIPVDVPQCGSIGRGC